MCHYFVEFMILGFVSLTFIIASFILKKRETKPLLWTTLLAFGILGCVVTGTYLAAAKANGYYDCKSRPGACPKPFPKGSSGYPCANPDVVCEDGEGDKEDLRCKTVPGWWFWESDCECKCLAP